MPSGSRRLGNIGGVVLRKLRVFRWSSSDVIWTKSGQPVKDGVAIYSFQAHAGTLFHDIAHILGGTKEGRRRVPCLYDHDLQAKPGPARKTFVDAIINMGFWDPMSCHYYQWESPPPGISSWTKLRLGWLDPSKVRVVQPGEKAEVLLAPLEDGRGGTLAVKVPLSDTTYYLFENRQPIGYDKHLPGKGMLVMYADDEVAAFDPAPDGSLVVRGGEPHFRRSDSRRLVSVKK